MTLYVNLAELLGTRIEQGFYRPIGSVCMDLIKIG